jgi:hypothetical protein
MLLAFAMSKYQLVAIRIRYNSHAYLIAQHSGFGLNPRFLELLDAMFNIGLDQRHRRSPSQLPIFVNLQPSARFESPLDEPFHRLSVRLRPSNILYHRTAASMSRTARKARTFFSAIETSRAGLERFCRFQMFLQRVDLTSSILTARIFVFFRLLVFGNIFLMICDHVFCEHFVKVCAGHF